MIRSLAVGLMLLPLGVAAQPQPDMEDHQDALLVVPGRTVQVDIASSYTWDQPDQTDAGLSARVGLGRGLEARIGLPPYSYAASTSGFGDVTLGIKAELGNLLGWTLASTLDTSLPIERSDIETIATLIAGRDLPAGLALELVGELAYNTADASPTGAATPTGAIALVVARRVLRQLDANVELGVGIESLDVDSVVIQNGYALLLNSTVQIHAAAGIGLDGPGAPEALLSLGGSVRL